MRRAHLRRRFGRASGSDFQPDCDDPLHHPSDCNCAAERLGIGGGYKVAYLVRGRRVYQPGPFTLTEAAGQVRAIKRHGMTAWVENSTGGFVAIPGTTRQPGFLP